MQTTKIEIYTDGSCIGNPGPGGWGAVILRDGSETKLSGGTKDTTNNRMEMTAVIEALKSLHKEEKDLQNCKISIYSDSNLIIQTMVQGWKKKANLDLWGEIEKLKGWLNIDWIWVKAHNLDKYNEMADQLAFNEAQKLT